MIRRGNFPKPMQTIICSVLMGLSALCWVRKFFRHSHAFEYAKKTVGVVWKPTARAVMTRGGLYSSSADDWNAKLSFNRRPWILQQHPKSWCCTGWSGFPVYRLQCHCACEICCAPGSNKVCRDRRLPSASTGAFHVCTVSVHSASYHIHVSARDAGSPLALR